MPRYKSRIAAYVDQTYYEAGEEFETSHEPSVTWQHLDEAGRVALERRHRAQIDKLQERIDGTEKKNYPQIATLKALMQNAKKKLAEVAKPSESAAHPEQQSLPQQNKGNQQPQRR